MDLSDICRERCDERMGSEACKYCSLGNPCIDCDNYDIEKDDCIDHEHGCWEDYTVRSSEQDTTITEKEEI